MEPPPPRFRGGNGPPLVLLHAALLTWRLWLPVLDRLTAERDVLAPTLPGHFGGPPVPSRGGFRSEGLDALETEMNAAGFGQVDIVGNSLGGLAGLELARRGRVRKLLAIAPVGMQTPAQWRAVERSFLTGYRRATIARRIVASRRAGMPARYLFLREIVSNPDRVPFELAVELMQAFLASDIAGLFEAGREADGSWPPTDRFGEIGTPVALLWGNRDRIVSRDQMERYLAALPDSRFVELSGLGHCPQLEAPDRIADEILSFTA